MPGEAGRNQERLRQADRNDSSSEKKEKHLEQETVVGLTGCKAWHTGHDERAGPSKGEVRAERSNSRCIHPEAQANEQETSDQAAKLKHEERHTHPPSNRAGKERKQPQACRHTSKQAGTHTHAPTHPHPHPPTHQPTHPPTLCTCA